MESVSKKWLLGSLCTHPKFSINNWFRKMKGWLVQHWFSHVSSPDSESLCAHWQAWLWGKRKLQNITKVYRIAFQIPNAALPNIDPWVLLHLSKTGVPFSDFSGPNKFKICRPNRAVQKYRQRAMRRVPLRNRQTPQFLEVSDGFWWFLAGRFWAASLKPQNLANSEANSGTQTYE